MADEQVIVVTGVASYWGNRVAARLLEQDNVHVIGIDDEPPQDNVDGLDFIQADLRNPLLVELFQEEGVQTVIHLKFRQARHTASEKLARECSCSCCAYSKFSRAAV